VVGHVAFTPVTISQATDPPRALGLAPLAVLPGHQGRDTGADLVRAGLAACEVVSHYVVFVLGSPAYYGRFGFRSAASSDLHYRGPEFDSAFQVVELRAGALGDARGTVHYLPAFDAV